MATYIALMNFTGQGIRNVKDSAKRAEAFKEAAKKLGVTVKDIYWTLGQYDIVATVEGPDDPSVTALGLSLGAWECPYPDTSRLWSSGDEADPRQDGLAVTGINRGTIVREGWRRA